MYFFGLFKTSLVTCFEKILKKRIFRTSRKINYRYLSKYTRIKNFGYLVFFFTGGHVTCLIWYAPLVEHTVSGPIYRSISAQKPKRRPSARTFGQLDSRLENTVLKFLLTDKTRRRILKRLDSFFARLNLQ